MKILHVYRTYFPDTQGGMEEVIRQICIGTRSHAVESRVFVLSPRPDPAVVEIDGTAVVRVKRTFELASCGFCFAGIREFRRQVAWADIVHYHFPWPWGDMLYMLAGRSRPSIVTYHSDIVRQQVLQYVYRPLMLRFLGAVTRIVPTSPNYYVSSPVLKRFADRVEVVSVGIEESTYPGSGENARLEEKCRAIYGEGFFLFVGVLRYYKGLHILLEAMQNASYQAVIVGSGPVEHELRAQAAALHLHNVVFTGHVSDAEKLALFRLCRAVVFPSYLRAEAFGVTLLEGAMSAKPLISAEIGSGTSHINIHGETGLVLPPGCPQSLREAMDFLHYNPRRAIQMGQRARHRYATCFTGAIMGANYARVYREVARETAVGITLNASPARF